MIAYFYRLKFLFFIFIIGLWGCNQKEQSRITNPIIDGYYADPSIIKYEGKFYIYATIDPWGGEELGVFVTEDFQSFEKEI